MKKKIDPNNLPERDIDVPQLHKKITVRTDGSPRSLTDAFAFVSGLLARNQLKDAEAGLDPKSPTHEVRHDQDGKYRLKRLRFS